MNPQPDADRPAPDDELAPDHDAVAGAGTDATTTAREPIDLDRVERDLAGVESALQRLDDGTYWTDEVTGEAIPDAVLAADPVARRVG